MVSKRKKSFGSGRKWTRIGCLTVLAIVSVGVSVRIACSKSSTVRFALTIEDRPVPDMSSCQALILHGAGFDYHKNACQECVLYKWFARALLANNLPMALTYRGYAQSRHHDGLGPNRDLKDMATEFVISTQIKDHEVDLHGRNFDGISLNRLIGVITKVPTDGAPYPWVLPRIKGKCYSKVVWDAAYWDLVGAFGTEDEKRRILSVESDYDWGRRLMVNGHVPSIGFENEETGFRLSFRDGVEGPLFARLDVMYPSANCFWGRDPSAQDFYDPLMRFVFAEMKKCENRGRTITGRFKSSRDGLNTGGVVGKVYVDGHDKPVLAVELDGCIRPTKQQCVDLQDVADVPDEAYAMQENLREVVFSLGLKRIGTCSFAGCGMLCCGQDVFRLPAGLESIGKGAFAGCSRLRRVEIPSSVTNLGAWAFADCIALQSVSLPSNIGEIPDGLFYIHLHEDCSGLETAVLPTTVKRIGKYAFASNTRLTEIDLPESVEEIDDYAFYCCTALTNVVIRGKLKRIGEAAFWGCEKLKRPELPPSVEVGEEAFGSYVP